ncbi:toll/interleukin-1 receptor domain-containing protein [Streptomyces sp. WAC 05379]|uniref:toll/interleukin-1 receptor domain-containing protein n=1 Tax=Streptomyces sp. WAC 05379 TaxID=2203207 RepID=UPI000F73F129|nr:toll/interleukin-1 receptor domain-containing protein [Streptomyces sp. WAC 05379]
MGEVFISHSARGDAFAMAVLKKIEKRLEKRNHTPRVDQSDIPPGDEWRPKIVHWLARCDAAVVLLNAKALESTWVRREVNILMWRRALGAPLLVVPVLLDGLTTKAVKIAGLEELGPIQFARTALGEEPDAKNLSGQVLDRFAELPEAVTGDDPMSIWLKRLGLYLSEVQRRSSLLVDAARALESEHEYVADVTAQHGGCLFLAHQFLVSPPQRVEAALDALAPSLPDDTLRRLTAALAPTWVDEEAARGVLPAPDKPPRRMTVLLNARATTTAEQYIRRATCAATQGFEVRSVGSLPMGEDRVGERFRIWENAVWREFFEADDEDDRVLPHDVDTRIHYLIINELCPPDAEFADAVKLLHRAFSWLIVLVTTGTPEPDDQVRAAFENAVLLRPLLTRQDEQTAKLRNKRLSTLHEQLAGTYS